MKRLKQLREEKRLNQQGLALQLNVSQAIISAYETGERTPDLDMLVRLSQFFCVSIDYLVGNSNIQRAPSESLSPEEMDFVFAYQRLGLLQREKLKAYMDGLQDA